MLSVKRDLLGQPGFDHGLAGRILTLAADRTLPIMTSDVGGSMPARLTASAMRWHRASGGMSQECPVAPDRRAGGAQDDYFSGQRGLLLFTRAYCTKCTGEDTILPSRAPAPVSRAACGRPPPGEAAPHSAAAPAYLSSGCGPAHGRGPANACDISMPLSPSMLTSSEVIGQNSCSSHCPRRLRGDIVHGQTQFAIDVRQELVALGQQSLSLASYSRRCTGP